MREAGNASTFLLNASSFQNLFAPSSYHPPPQHAHHPRTTLSTSIVYTSTHLARALLHCEPSWLPLTSSLPSSCFSLCSMLDQGYRRAMQRRVQRCTEDLSTEQMGTSTENLTLQNLSALRIGTAGSNVNTNDVLSCYPTNKRYQGPSRKKLGKEL